MLQLAGIGGHELKLIHLFIQEKSIDLERGIFVSSHPSFFVPFLLLTDHLHNRPDLALRWEELAIIQDDLFGFFDSVQAIETETEFL